MNTWINMHDFLSYVKLFWNKI